MVINMSIKKKEPEYKQCIIVRADLNLSTGKIAVQAAHASILAYNKAKRGQKANWLHSGQKKVALKVGSIEELYLIRDEAKQLGLPFAIVADAGLTEIPPGTVTALGIGPEKTKDLDKVTGNLKLL